MTNAITMDRDSSELLALLRSLAIITIVVGHVGLFWLKRPWTEFLHVTVPLFFFISGAVSYYAFCRTPSVSSYLIKRSVGLLIPYYLMAVLALLFFIIDHQQLPQWSIESAWRWLTIAPNNALMPFPLGQVWFLNVLLIICLISPLLFRLIQRRSKLLWCWLAVAVLLAALQHGWILGSQFWLLLHNFYKPVVHSLFFVLGALWLSHASHWPALRFGWLTALLLLATVTMALGLDLEIDYAFHTYYPDLYYVSGSLAAIAACCALQQPLLWLYRRPLLRPLFAFFFTHTLSVYLLHSLVIYGCDRWLSQAGASLGGGWLVVKPLLVLALTAM
nr:acyltransferase [Corallincola sp.]